MAVLPAPESNELGLLRFLDSLEEEGKSARDFSSKHWEENIRQVRGDQWRLAKPPHFLANIIRNQVERKVASLTEAQPSIRVTPTKPGLSAAAWILNQTCKSIWETQQVDQVIYRLAYLGMTLGSGFINTYYDPAAAGFQGDIQIRHIDPRRVVVDPGVTETENLRTSAYIVVESFDTLNNIRQRFPGRGLMVKPDTQYSTMMSTRGQSPGIGAGLMSAVLRSMPRVFKPGQSTKQGPIERASLREYWIADPQLGKDGLPMFPTGRHVIRAGNIVLVDEVNPFWDGQWPIDMFDWQMDFDSPWGLGEVQDLRRIQEAFNRIGDGIVRNTLISNNVKVIADMDALEPDKWNELTNEGGIIIKKRPGRELTYEMPREMPSYLFMLMGNLLQYADMITGNTDVGGGKRPSGVVAASALEGLQQSAQTLVRAVARRLEGVMERMGQKLVSRIIQFYTADRMLHLLGPSKEWISYTYERQRLFMDDKGAIRDPLTREQMYTDFRFMIVPGSSLATTRVQRTMMMAQLRGSLQVPVPSIRDILRESGIGDPDQMIQDGFTEAQTLGLGGDKDEKKKK